MAGSPYFQEMQKEVRYLQYQQQSRFYPLYLISGLLLLAFGLFIFLRKRRRATALDPIAEKQKELTVQEQKIFQLLSKGKANKEISSELNIEVSPVKSHLNSIYAKLGVKSRKEVYNWKRKKK